MLTTWDSNSKFNIKYKFEIKMKPFHLKNQDGVDFWYFI
jgi:hypothetical protein